MGEYRSYIDGQIRKVNLQEARVDSQFRELNERVKDVCLTIAHKYSLTRVVLFGSLTDRSRFRLDSDIDIAVTGLDPTLYLDLWGDLENLLNHPFDLVQFERASPSLQTCILQEGVLLYDGEHEESQ